MAKFSKFTEIRNLAVCIYIARDHDVMWECNLDLFSRVILFARLVPIRVYT